MCVFWFPTKGPHGPFSQPDLSLSSSLSACSPFSLFLCFIFKACNTALCRVQKPYVIDFLILFNLFLIISLNYYLIESFVMFRFFLCVLCLRHPAVFQPSLSSYGQKSCVSAFHVCAAGLFQGSLLWSLTRSCASLDS